MSLFPRGRALPALLAALSLSLCVSTHSLGAQSASSTPPVVDAGSASVRAADAPSRAAARADVLVLEGEALAAVKAAKASDLLRQVAGVAVVDYGNAGGQTNLSIRGSTAAQVVVIVDGKRLNNAMSGAPDLAQLGADQIERIEVLRGGAATAYGADALGGVVYVTTKKNAADGLDFQAENRSRFVDGDARSLVNAQHLSFAARLGGQDVRLGLHGSFDNDYGIFAYKDAGGGDRVRRQLPTDYGRGGLDLAAPLGNGRFSAALEGQGGRTGTPGPLSSLSPEAYTDDAAADLNLAWKTDSFFNDALDFSARLTGGWRQYKTNTDAAATDLFALDLDLRQSALAADWLTLNYGLAGGWQTAYKAGMLDAVGQAPHRLSGGAFLNPLVKIGRWTVDPALRADLFSDFPAGLTASLGLEYAASDLVTLRLAGGRSYRAPTYNDMYYPGLGNPNLRPESAWNADAGIVVANAYLTSRSSGFVRYVQDGITWAPDGSGIYHPSNVDSALYPGFDQDVSLQVDWFRAGANYEFLHSYYLSGGTSLAADRRMANTPEHRFGFRLGGVWEHFELRLEGQVVGTAYTSSANTKAAPAYCVLNASASYRFDAKTELYLAADNLLNASYQVKDGYPMPGFGLRLGLKASI